MGVMYISSAGRMEMKVTETPARRAEEGCPRRDSAYDRREEATDHQDEALKEHPDQASLPTLDRIVRLKRDREHYHESDDKHVRHAHARWQRADVLAAGFQGEPVGEPRVIHGRKAHHQAKGGQDAAENKRIRHLQHEPQQACKHQHVDQDVGPEPEERVPVAGNPQGWSFQVCCSRHHHTLPSMICPVSRTGSPGCGFVRSHANDMPAGGRENVLALEGKGAIFGMEEF